MGLSPYLILLELNYYYRGVKKLLLGLDLSKSPIPDKIPGKLLKVMASEITLCLSSVFTASLQQGTVPQSWNLQ